MLAGLGIALGRASAPIPVTAQSEPCTISFLGTVRLGPSAGQLLHGGATPGELQGSLTFTSDQTGAIGMGQLQLPDGTIVPVVGQHNGRAINLRLDMGNQQVLVAVGTAAQDLATCQGAVDGLLTGPHTGDLGDWHGLMNRQTVINPPSEHQDEPADHHEPVTNHPTESATHHPEDDELHHPTAESTMYPMPTAPPMESTMVPTSGSGPEMPTSTQTP
ncbi:MAG TPA: hypothetical protein VFL82_16180 [Thermomicrobiales bacterium]|nr:hypothetical protein [Thermomicrobiales bacterium]